MAKKEIHVDFVEWCGVVLKTCIEVMKTSSKARSIGVDEFELAQALSTTLGIENFRKQSEYNKSSYYIGMYYAISGLKNANLIENDPKKFPFWKVSKAGHEYDRDPTILWWSICQEKLELEHLEFLQLINRLSAHSASDHAWLELVEHQTIASETGWPSHQLWNVARELNEWGYVSGSFSLALTVKLHATYKGLVWETRQKFTIESKFIDDLVAEWETTSVEFKQYLYIKAVEQKAEFIKDVLSLANTKASGRRWMIIGFNNKTHDYSNPPNADLNQDDLERLIGEYIHPYLDVVYKVVEYRKGLVGKLEVLRNPQKLPYRVAKSLGDKLKGDKKQIFKGQIFIRHGTQVVVARGTERKELLEEGKRARSNPQI